MQTSIYNNKILRAFLIICLGTFCFCYGCNRAMAANTTVAYRTISPIKITITYNKTTNLVFPTAIKSADRGSEVVLAQVANGSENILQIKAGVKGFEQTNLTVITVDGSLYSFLIDYQQDPPILNIILLQRQETKPLVKVSQQWDKDQVNTTAALVKAKSSKLHQKLRQDGIEFKLAGLYIQKGVLYFQLKVKNTSAIDYSISQLRLFIKDGRKMRRTASQMVELQPILKVPTTQVVLANAERTYVLAVAALTIPDKKHLSIQLKENNGGRNFSLRIHEHRLLKAIPL